MNLEVTKIRWAALRGFLFCAFTTGLGYYFLPKMINLPEEPFDKVTFVLRADLFVIFWVIFAVGVVSHGRRQNVKDIWGSAFGPPSTELAIKVAFLQNTLEQAFMAIFVHLALATLLPSKSLALILVGIFLFGIGRVTFYRGYPKGAGGRAFGIVTTVLPTIFGFILAIVLLSLRY